MQCATTWKIINSDNIWITHSREKIEIEKGALTETERYVINAHAFLSYYTLLRFSLPEIICEMALYHHSTSPSLFDRILPPCKDEDVRKLSIILKTIDIFEAITSDRPYHTHSP